MDKRTTGILATVAALLLCGCPGIFACLFGGLSAAGLGTWTTQFGGSGSSGGIPQWAGVTTICVGLVLVAIPIVVALLTLRRKPEPIAEEVPPPA